MSSMRRAVVAAREWLSGRRHVVVERRTLPEEMPDGPFDPIVTSEILYVVVGSGFIGCEAAASLALRGAAVTLASHEQSPQRKRLGDEVGERTEGWLRDFGVDLRLGVRIEGVERTDGGLTVNLDDGTPSIREPSSSRPASGSPRRPVSRWTTGSSQTPPCGRASQGSSGWETLPSRTTSPGGRHLSVEHWGDALEHGRIAGSVIASSEAAWNMVLGFWSTIGDKTLKYWAWGDGWDEQVFEDGGEAFTVWYDKGGVLVGVLSHGTDEDYQQGRGRIEPGESFS